MEPETPNDAWALEQDDEPAVRRAPWLLIAGVVPWVVLAVMLLRPATAPGTDTATMSTTIAEAGASEDTTTGPVAPPPPSGATATILSSGAPAGPSASELAAVAVVIARAHLSGAGPRLAVAGAEPAPDRYVEHATVESVTHPGPGAAVVTVLAVVLTVADGAYADVALTRVAVPLTLDGTRVAPAGPVWMLPPPDLAPEPLTTGDPIEDPVVLTEAGAALVRAGFTDTAVDELVATASWPLIATVDAVAPGDVVARRHEVWLRSHLGDLVVAGARPTREDLP